MGQGPSHDIVHLETRVEDPENGVNPRGLALIAHGKGGGDFNVPPIRVLAKYLRDERQLRVVTWNARGIGRSGGRTEWTDFNNWIGTTGIDDYNRMLRESMSKFAADFPKAQGAQLFICGYSMGAISAGCVRPPPSFRQFGPAHYILVSYPVDLNPFIYLTRSGSYFQSVEGLIQGYSWVDLPAEFHGLEPEVAGVLIVTPQWDTFLFYNMWRKILVTKNKRKALKQVVVNGAHHMWGDKASCVIDEVHEWLHSL